MAESAGRISKETAVELLTAARARNPGETTHFSVVDRDDVAVAVTTSINNYYGAQVASPSLGFLYNDYMHEFVLDDPAHPFALRGGARPFSSMSALILSRDGSPRMAVGSPGSTRIISAVSQVVQLWADGPSRISGAVAAPQLASDPAGSPLLRRPASRLARALRPAGLELLRGAHRSRAERTERLLRRRSCGCLGGRALGRPRRPPARWYRRNGQRPVSRQRQIALA